MHIWEPVYPLQGVNPFPCIPQGVNPQTTKGPEGPFAIHSLKHIWVSHSKGFLTFLKHSLNHSMLCPFISQPP